jgi:Domain of unknown function (DUF2935)
MSSRLAHLMTFWSRQFSDHCLFMALGFQDLELRKDARHQHEKWEYYRDENLVKLTVASDSRLKSTAETVLEMCRVLRGLKIHAFDRLEKGEWLGWLYPSFIDHTRRELDYAVAAIHREVEGDPVRARKQLLSDELGTWLRFMQEHAAFAKHLLEPGERDTITQAFNIETSFRQAEGLCQGASESLIELSRRAGTILDKFLKGPLSKARSIIHPLLAEHVVREGEEFQRTLDALAGNAIR